MKVCNECKQEKDEQEFSIRSGKSKYLWRGSVCKLCAAKLQKGIRLKRKELGLCIKCGQPAKEGVVSCQKCLDLDLETGRRKKKSGVEYLGGKCMNCGLQSKFMSVYDFHHRNPKTKRFGLGTLVRYSWDLILEELDKCDLLCSNCHRIVHEKIDRGEV